MLFFIIILLSIINIFLPSLFVKAINLLPKSSEQKHLQKSLKLLTDEQSTISMTEEWAKYAKLQRRINKLRDKLKVEHSNQSSKTLKYKHILLWTCRVAFILLAINYRSEVVIVLPEKWFWPISSLIFWSNDIVGGITVPLWLGITSSATQSLKTCLITD